MEKITFDYTAGKVACTGYLVYDKAWVGKRPAIVISHTWQGLNSLIKQRAEEIAGLGIVAFAADLYGNGTTAETNDEACDLMLPLFLNRALLRERMIAAYNAAKKLPFVDAERLGAVGFCFGGLAAIELFRSGAKLQGVTSFHGVLGDEFLGNKATLTPLSKTLYGSLLLLHGYLDPLVPMDQLLAFQKEMTSVNVDWQTIIYGSASHGFTNPEASDKKGGLCFDPVASKRSFEAMQQFFKERFK